MRALMRALALVSVVLFACGGPLPRKIEAVPAAAFPPPVTTVSPPPGPFNGELTLTFTTDFPATVYVTTDGSDPRTTSKTRVQGPSPFTVTLKATSTVSYFASEGGRDEDLHVETWTRAGGKKGTISGVIVVGDFAVGQELGVRRNFDTQKLGKVAMPSEVPFVFEDLMSGTHTLTAIADRSGDGQLIPFLDFESDPVSVTLDLNDPAKAAAENVRLYLASSAAELCTIKGTVSLPNPPTNLILSVGAFDASAFTSISDPQALLSQLQNGYRINTNASMASYPYVLTDLKPGRYLPVPSLFGLGAGGLAMTFVVNILQPVNCEAGKTVVANLAFGPASITGDLTVKPPLAPQAGLAYGMVAARHSSITQGVQVVLMPSVFIRDQGSMNVRGGFAGQALRASSSFATRVFVNGGAGNPLVEGLVWAVNPLSPQPPHATIPVGTGETPVTLTVP